jgi:HPt (histidine-containing phosphotransfer) domain-containing protein
MNGNLSSRAYNEQLLTTETAPPTKTVGTSTLFNRPVLNRAELTTRVGGDAAFADELCALFCSSSRTLLSELQAALKLSDAQQLIAKAHTLKGAALNIGAPMIAWQAWWLVEAARERDWVLAVAAWKTLREELARFETEVNQT